MGLLRVAREIKSLWKGTEPPSGEFCAFSASDINQLYQLDRECLISPWSFEGFLMELNQPYTYCWGKREAGDIVAFIMVHVILDEAHILKIGVDPSLRRLGIAKRLLEFSFKKFQELNVQLVYLEVRKSEAGARALYEQAGFHKSGERRDYYGKEEGYAQERENAILYTRKF